VLTDSKMGKLTAQDVAQMDSYVRLFDDQYTSERDNPTIGLILCMERNEAEARYSVLHGGEQIFAARYVTWLTTVEELRAEIRRERLLNESGRDPRWAWPSPTPLQPGAVVERVVADFDELRRLRRQARLAQPLPDALYDAFATRTANLPRSTEAERMSSNVWARTSTAAACSISRREAAPLPVSPSLACCTPATPASGRTARPTGSASTTTTGSRSNPPRWRLRRGARHRGG